MAVGMCPELDFECLDQLGAGRAHTSQVPGDQRTLPCARGRVGSRMPLTRDRLVESEESEDGVTAGSVRDQTATPSFERQAGRLPHLGQEGRRQSASGSLLPTANNLLPQSSDAGALATEHTAQERAPWSGEVVAVWGGCIGWHVTAGEPLEGCLSVAPVGQGSGRRRHVATGAASRH